MAHIICGKSQGKQTLYFHKPHEHSSPGAHLLPFCIQFHCWAIHLLQSRTWLHKETFQLFKRSHGARQGQIRSSREASRNLAHSHHQRTKKDYSIFKNHAFCFVLNEALCTIQRRCPTYFELNYKHCTTTGFYVSKFQLDLASKKNRRKIGFPEGLLQFHPSIDSIFLMCD